MSSAYAVCATVDAGRPVHSCPAEIDAKHFDSDTARIAPGGPGGNALTSCGLAFRDQGSAGAPMSR
jgi:hypothetical protein